MSVNKPVAAAKIPHRIRTPENQPLHTSLLRIIGGRHLEKEVTEEEERTKQRGRGGIDVKVVSHAARGAEAVVGAIDIGEAVGDEGDRYQPAPAARVSARCYHRHDGPPPI